MDEINVMVERKFVSSAVPGSLLNFHLMPLHPLGQYNCLPMISK